MVLIPKEKNDYRGIKLVEGGNFFNAVVQAVLLFGAKMWVLTPRMERALESFQHEAVRRITGRQPRRRGNGR